MRLLYIAFKRMDRFSGGRTHITEMLKALSDQGVDVTLIVPKANKPTGLEKMPFKTVFMPFINFPDFLKQFKRLRSLDLVLDSILHILSFGAVSTIFFLAFHLRNRFDVVQIREQEGGLIPAVFARFLKVPLVYEINGFSSVELPLYGKIKKESFAIKFIEKLERALIKLSTMCIAVSEETTKKVNKLKQCKCISNGVSIDKFKGTDFKNLPKQLFRIKRKKKIIGYIGSVRPWQGVDQLLATFSEISNPRNDLLLLIASRKKMIKQLKPLLKKMGINKKTILLKDQLPELIPSLLNFCNVLVAPFPPIERNLEYGFSSIKLLEYMGSGKVIVSTKIPSVQRYLNESNAILVEPSNPTSLAEGLIRAIDNKSDLLAKTAKADAMKYSWNNISTELIEIYGSLTNRG